MAGRIETYVLVVGIGIGAVLLLRTFSPPLVEPADELAAATVAPVAVERTIVVDAAPIELDDVAPSIGRVLAEAGNAQALTSEELAEIPDSIRGVLAEHGATLVVPEAQP